MTKNFEFEQENKPIDFQNLENLNWLNVGESFSKDAKIKIIKDVNDKNPRPKAVDYFNWSSDSDVEKDNKKIKEKDIAIVSSEIQNYNDDAYCISDFSSDEERKHKKKTEEAAKSKEIKYKNKLYRYLIKEKKTDSSLFGKTIEIYSGSGIIEKYFQKKKRKRKHFLTKFELKYLTFEQIKDLSFSINSLGRRENYTYGSLQIKDVPQFKRVNTKQIVGLRNSKASRQILEDLNIMIGQYPSTKKSDEKKSRYYSKLNIKALTTPTANDEDSNLK